MKYYNFKKATELIEKNIDNLKSASLGMHEDWCWTATTVWGDGKFIKDFPCEIGGITGSYWATPTLELEFKDGSNKMIECHDNGESTDKPEYFQLGVLSQPVQDNITPISKS